MGLSSRREGVFKILVGLGILAITLLLASNPGYPPGDERGQPTFVAFQTAFGVFISAVAIIGGIVRLSRP
jgi:hypothetical protein